MQDGTCAWSSCVGFVPAQNIEGRREGVQRAYKPLVHGLTKRICTSKNIRGGDQHQRLKAGDHVRHCQVPLWVKTRSYPQYRTPPKMSFNSVLDTPCLISERVPHVDDRSRKLELASHSVASILNCKAVHCAPPVPGHSSAQYVVIRPAIATVQL